MFIRTQNIYSLNNPVHLAILLILVQTINKNFTQPPSNSDWSAHVGFRSALPIGVNLRKCLSFYEHFSIGMMIEIVLYLVL